MDWSAAHDDRPPRSDAERARRAGITLEGLQRLRSLFCDRSRAAWAIGDVLVSAYGPASTSGHSDGSRARMAIIADDLGVAVAVLVNYRATASAWPVKQRRPSAAWSIHAALRANPDRFAVLAEFLDRCQRDKVTPTLPRLEVAVHGHVYSSRRKVTVARIERLAATLDTDALSELIDHLAWRLFAGQTEDAA